MSQDLRDQIVQNGHRFYGSEYYTNKGAEINFRNPHDKAVGYHDPEKRVNQEPKIEGEFDQDEFNKQYIHVTKVVDTDYDNFLVIYSCHEAESFINIETGEEYQNDSSIWDNMTSSIGKDPWGDEIVKFNVDPKLIASEPAHIHKIGIYMRAQMDPETGKTWIDHDKIDQQLLDKLIS